MENREKIIFKINRNMLSISLLKKDMPKVDLNNTNIIDTKEIIFSADYIRDNLELVSSFLNVIIIKREVKRVTIKDFEIIMIVLKLINLIPSLEELYIRADKAINYPIFMLLLENKSLKLVDVYDIPAYFLERLDLNKDLTINIRTEIFFISNFMSDNLLKSYSDLYYAKNITIYHDFTAADYEDFNTFININYHLRSITFAHFNGETLEYILNALTQGQKSNLEIILNQKDNDLHIIHEVINNLKKKYEKDLKNQNITFKIHYSNEFKYQNLFKQINLNFVKIGALGVICLIFLLMGINYYKNALQEKDIENIEEEIKSILNAIEEDYDFDDQDDDIEIIEPLDLNKSTTKKSNYVSSYYKNYEKVFTTLLKINKDTKGWLTVNNTRIDYPVTQYKNNDYYIKHDYNKNKNSMGWVFMDYRNKIDTLDQNTIIYGHNIANGGIMFGTLRYTLNKSWYTKTANQIITFNTLNTNMKWQIFAIYTIPNTTDYLITNFNSETEFKKFLDKIKKRSIYDFKQTVSTSDKILTLSTCQNRGEKRLVVHAKLIKDEGSSEISD